jgi:hypothetical protein
VLRIALAAALMLASVGAYAQFNKCGRGFCPGGINGPGVTTPGGSITPPVGCASTGIFDLNNVCNDVYFIGALK